MQISNILYLLNYIHVIQINDSFYILDLIQLNFVPFLCKISFNSPKSNEISTKNKTRRAQQKTSISKKKFFFYLKLNKIFDS